MTHKIMTRRCDQCLYSPAKIVSDRRRSQILRECAEKDVSFYCHKGTIAGQEIDCRGHYDATGGGKVARFAKWLGVITEIDPGTLKPAANTQNP